MPVPSVIKDSKSANSARVTRFGQLVVSPLDFSTPIDRELSSPNVAVNFLTPEQDKLIIITDLIISTDKNVSNVDPANIEIYQADSADSLIANPSIVRPQMIRASNFIMTGLNWFIPEGKWINAKTNDAGVLITIAFYRIPTDLKL